MKIAVMGSAPSSRLLAPFGDPGWEIWACSPPNYDLPRIDAWFEMHNLDRKFSHPGNGPWVQKLLTHPRVYIAKPDSRMPNGIVYPLPPMLERFGRYFFTSTIAYMLAFAISLKPEKIGLWGIDMSAAEELYTHQRPACHFFIREAQKAGIEVVAAPQSDVMNPPPLYGFKEFTRMWNKQKARKEELKGRAANAHQQIEKHMAELRTFQGALDDIDYVNNTYDPVAFEEGIVGKPVAVEIPVQDAPKLLIELAPEMLDIVNDV
jgi:hypothetical protein